ncbi:MAG: DUF4065 domain-containing protein [Candidatus Aegiribacteria sp.]|nr:DUF4065 domain-containing protein [Candidatus Aegiribacteria sp.]
MRMFCPICEEVHDVQVIQQEEPVTVRGEQYLAIARYYRCPESGEEFETSDSPFDPLADAYYQYRERHKMLTPEKIRSFRHEYELTQKELSDLLGWGAVTLSRYENGSLQDFSHDNQLQLAMIPENLIQLINRNSDALSKDKSNRLLDILTGKRGARNTTLECVEKKLISKKPSIWNGFRKFNIEKFMGVVEFFCSELETYPTKLNKLLFYSDFLHYRENTVSITGALYAHAPWGPVPDDFKTLLAMMEEELAIFQSEEIAFEGKAYTGVTLTILTNDHITALDTDEIETLRSILKTLGHLSSSELSKLSHGENAYKETTQGELITYEYAEFLDGIKAGVS